MHGASPSSGHWPEDREAPLFHLRGFFFLFWFSLTQLFPLRFPVFLIILPRSFGSFLIPTRFFPSSALRFLGSSLAEFLLSLLLRSFDSSPAWFLPSSALRFLGSSPTEFLPSSLPRLLTTSVLRFLGSSPAEFLLSLLLRSFDSSPAWFLPSSALRCLPCLVLPFFGSFLVPTRFFPSSALRFFPRLVPPFLLSFPPFPLFPFFHLPSSLLRFFLDSYTVLPLLGPSVLPPPSSSFPPFLSSLSLLPTSLPPFFPSSVLRSSPV